MAKKKAKKRVAQWYKYDGRAFSAEVGSKTEERLIGYKAEKITPAQAAKLPGGTPAPVAPPAAPLGGGGGSED